jgi:hypothetical protein
MSVHGHWRSGAHYLNALLKLNFDHEDYTTRGHAFPGNWVTASGPVFYTTRNFADVSDSLWRLRGRFGIKADSYEDFLNTKYRDMYHDYGKVKVGFHGKTVNSKSAGTIAKIDMTPLEYWEKHTRAWKKHSHPDVHHVDYDNLQENFQEEMLKIAQYLKSARTAFEDIGEAQGWYSL